MLMVFRTHIQVRLLWKWFQRRQNARRCILNSLCILIFVLAFGGIDPVLRKNNVAGIQKRVIRFDTMEIVSMGRLLKMDMR